MGYGRRPHAVRRYRRERKGLKVKAPPDPSAGGRTVLTPSHGMGASAMLGLALVAATGRWPRSLCTDWASAAFWACRDAPSTRSSRSTRPRSPAHRAATAIPRLRLRTRAAVRPRRRPAVPPVAAPSSSRLLRPGPSARSGPRPKPEPRPPRRSRIESPGAPSPPPWCTPTGDARSTHSATTSVASNTTSIRALTAINAVTMRTAAPAMGTIRTSITPPIAAATPLRVTTPDTSRRSGTETPPSIITAANRTPHGHAGGSGHHKHDSA